MELLSKVGRYEFLSEPFHCDFSSHLFMGHLGNHLLNAADFHSNDRGYGMNYLMPRHKTWVLSRLAIEMTEMPKSYDKFYVETWVENAMKYFTARDFKICGKPAGVYRGRERMSYSSQFSCQDVCRCQVCAQYRHLL